MVSESRIVEAPAGARWLERRFRLAERRTSPRIELIAGATTFLAAAYLLVVIPSILASGGLDRGAATTTTIMVFVAATLFMAFYANLPFIVGPGIGGSVIIATTLVLSEGVPWQAAMAIAFWSGVLFPILTLLGLREVVTRMVPVQIKLALSASIGIFIAVLGFRNAGLVLANAKTNAMMLGDFTKPGAVVALIGLAIAVLLHARKVPGSILWAILGATAIGIPLGVTKLPAALLSLPHDIGPVTWQLDFVGALSPVFFPYLFAFFAAEFSTSRATWRTSTSPSSSIRWRRRSGRFSASRRSPPSSNRRPAPRRAGGPGSPRSPRRRSSCWRCFSCRSP
jgi:adenine/guanine/hypoxanthine permease